MRKQPSSQSSHVSSGRRSFLTHFHLLTTLATVRAIENVVNGAVNLQLPQPDISVPTNATNISYSEAETADLAQLDQSSQIAANALNALALLLLPLLCFVGLVGNAFVCVAIATDRRLQNVTNYFLFSLALADLLVCCIVMPLSIVVEVKHGVWTWSFNMCLLYVYADIFLCSASIVHMSVISLDRYLGISQPLKTRNKSRTAIFIKISLVWLITILISSPLAAVALHEHSNVLQHNICAVHSRSYQIYGSTLAFLIPFLIMAITYIRTTNLLNKQASVINQSSSQGGGGLRRAAPPRKVGYQSGRRSSTSNATGEGTTGTGSAGGKLCSTESVPGSSWQTGDAAAVKKRSSVRRWKNRTSTYISTLVSRVQRRTSYQSQSTDLMNEHKATRVLAVVFVCFFICWTPFFAANFVSGFCGDACTLPPWLGSLFLWLGYVSSTINPLIYTIFNKRFRQSFIRILRGQCCHPYRRSANSTHFSRTHTILPDTFTYSNLERERAISREENGGVSSRSTISRSGITISLGNINNGDVAGSPRMTHSNGAAGSGTGHHRSVAFETRCGGRRERNGKPERHAQQAPSITPPKKPLRSLLKMQPSMSSIDDESEEDESDIMQREVPSIAEGRPLVFHASSGSVTNTTTSSPSSTPSVCSPQPQDIDNRVDRNSHSSSLRRSMTGSILEAPTRCIAAAELIAARPLFMYHHTAKRFLISHQQPDGSDGNNMWRKLASDDALAKRHKLPPTTGRERGDCDSSSARQHLPDNLPKQKNQASDSKHDNRNYGSSLSPPSSSSGPHLTLVSANNRGEVYKETFL